MQQAFSSTYCAFVLLLSSVFAAGMVTLTNHNPDLTDQDICRMLQAEYGEVYSIMTPPDNLHKRHIEFCDVRHAQAAKQALEGIAAKIPTISEVRTYFLPASCV